MKSPTGYTLIELIIVIVIISILSAIVIVKYPAPSKMYLQACNDKLIRDLRFAQNTAILQKQITGVKLDLTLNKYCIYQGDQNFTNVLTDPSDSSRYEILLNTTFPGVKIISTTLGGLFVQFDADGVPFESAGRISSIEQIILSETSSKNATINIIPETGTIR